MFGLSPEQIGAAIVGLLLAFEGWNNRKRRKTITPDTAAMDKLTDQIDKLADELHEIKDKIHELHDIHLGARAIDPTDGQPRWYSRDLERAILEELKGMK